MNPLTLYLIQQEVPLSSLLFLAVRAVGCVPSYEALPHHWRELLAETGLSDRHFAGWAGTHPLTGRIIAVGMAYFSLDQNPSLEIRLLQISSQVVRQTADADTIALLTLHEKHCLQHMLELVNRFIQYLEARKGPYPPPQIPFYFAGFQVAEKILPMVCHRLIAQHLPLPPYLAHLMGLNYNPFVVDLARLWRVGGWGKPPSLNMLREICFNYASLESSASPNQFLTNAQIHKTFWEDPESDRILAQDLVQELQLIARLLWHWKGKALQDFPVVNTQTVDWAIQEPSQRTES